MGKAAVKHSVIYNFFSGCIASSLTKTIGLFVGSFLFTRIVEDHTPQYLPVSYLSYLVPLGYAVYSLKLLVFELLLLIHIVQWSVGKWDWYTKVDENVFLGAIPMTSLGHVSELTKKLRIHAVLSINENYELNACTFAGCPVTYIQWKDLDVDQYAIPSKDFLPPSFAVLMEGADYINFHVQEGRNVYCHCKSGGSYVLLFISYALDVPYS